MKVKKGFTLIELIVCMAIAGIIMSLMLFYYKKGKSNNELRAAANELVADLEYAKSCALRCASTATLDFSLPQSGYTSGYTIKDVNNKVYKKSGIKPNITLSASKIVSGSYALVSNPTVKFYSNMTCEYSYSITLQSNDTGKAFDARVTDSTGLVKLVEH